MVSKDLYAEYHGRHDFIWTTKYSRAVFTEEMIATLEKLIRDLCDSASAQVNSIEVKPNGVYLSVFLEPQYGEHLFIKMIKRETAGSLREAYPELKSKLPCIWTNRYYYYAVGSKPTEAQIKKVLEGKKR